ncbi:hypothetical protein [Nocardioides perillae]|uniref:TetR family transcriptional regulator n=1 Tax=Nocardioides perillae TaxID=1119534 RepID=A0A7Y9RR90_9ACTN|nr:hypothetical protein [Nocardioides perillae]NYG53944.1 hypothetical protein [Nocardioides perillae]
MTERLRRLAGETAHPDPDALAALLLVLYNGVLGSLLRGAPADPVAAARTAARAALRA